MKQGSFNVKEWARDWSLVGIMFGSLATGVSYAVQKWFPDGILKATASGLNGLFTGSVTFSTVALDVNVNQQIVQVASLGPFQKFMSGLLNGVFTAFNGVTLPNIVAQIIWVGFFGIIISLLGRAVFQASISAWPKSIRNDKMNFVISLFTGMGIMSLIFLFTTGGWSVSVIASLLLALLAYSAILGLGLYYIYLGLYKIGAKMFRQPW